MSDDLVKFRADIDQWTAELRRQRRALIRERIVLVPLGALWVAVAWTFTLTTVTWWLVVALAVQTAALCWYCYTLAAHTSAHALMAGAVASARKLLDEIEADD